MEIEILSKSMLKPTIIPYTKTPLTIFDRAASDLHICVLFFYTRAVDTPHLKHALAEALSLFPPLAGRIVDEEGLLSLVVDDTCGVSLVETFVHHNLSDFLPVKQTPELSGLHQQPEGTNPVFLVQMNRFACGGLVLGLGANHRVADGQSMNNFFTAWSQIIREMEIDPVPVHDNSLLVPRNPPVAEYPHQDIEFSAIPPVGDNFDIDTMENIVVHYSWDFIKELKEKAVENRPGVRKHSTFECLLSHVWRKMTMARGIDGESTTRVRVLVNGRPRLGITNQFFGNLVLPAFPTTKAKNLIDGGVAQGARVIQDAVARINADYFQSFIDFGELNKEKVLMPEQDVEDNALCPDLEVDSWLGFEFHKIDMGGGPPAAFTPSWIPMEGIVILIPTPMTEKSHGTSSGVNVIVTLFEEHAAVFKRICHNIN